MTQYRWQSSEDQLAHACYADFRFLGEVYYVKWKGMSGYWVADLLHPRSQRYRAVAGDTLETLKEKLIAMHKEATPLDTPL